MFWLPHLHAGTVVLTANPNNFANSIPFAPTAWPGRTTLRHAPDGLYVLFRNGPAQHRLWLREPPPEGAPVAALLPLDGAAPTRAESTLCFWRHVRTGRMRCSPSLTKQRLDRLTSALRALDARLADASYRTIAEALHGPSRVAAEPWKTASVRDATIRLARSGLAMMKDGYRNLLGARPSG